ncbi:MAG: ABC transporter ATP-binding protein [Proteobacteria bacterium]|nr:ABC transporter ATP-binding protein [Pseudomonadota bacterium]
MIRCVRLSKSYGNVRALDTMNIEVGKGQIYGLIGPNGAGKTTTIKLIVGLIQPTSGSVFINGLDMRQNPLEAKRFIGYIPDEPFLYERLTPWELMDFKGSLYNMTKVEIDSKKSELLDVIGMLEYKNDLIEGFSLGMKQRVAVAIALLPSPPVIVVDEPLVGLDPRGMKRVKEIFLKLAREGKTVFISTHMLNVVEEISDVVGVLDRGQLIAEGPLEILRGSKDEKLETIFFRLFA